MFKVQGQSEVLRFRKLLVQSEGLPEQDVTSVGNCIFLGTQTERVPNNKNDWGDDQTVNAFVIRINSKYEDNDRYGRYLGNFEHEGKTVFVIGLIGKMSMGGTNIESLECYESLEEMKSAWRLD
ncbi:MAG TPA: hypothetical protein PKA63_05225 [Oligoflexia bacterium]|nr:hypothetical protein [Oligoflexia bacterium]HMP48049.1 hypothetical protein [Oligoflexia bacterium]